MNKEYYSSLKRSLEYGDERNEELETKREKAIKYAAFLGELEIYFMKEDLGIIKDFGVSKKYKIM